MIYVYIAASYSPWLTLHAGAGGDGWGGFFDRAVWSLAVCGILYQQVFHERFKWLDTTFYLFISLLPAIVLFERVS